MQCAFITQFELNAFTLAQATRNALERVAQRTLRPASADKGGTQTEKDSSRHGDASSSLPWSVSSLHQNVSWCLHRARLLL